GMRGVGDSTAGNGAKVMIKHESKAQMLEQVPRRGFESSVGPRLHFGLGRSTKSDSLTVVWPDRRYQILINVPADRFLTLSQTAASGHYVNPRGNPATPLFADVTARVGVDFKHNENDFR